MGFLGALFGGSQGAGFQAQSANVVNPSTVDQANQLYGQTQQGLQQQQQMLAALQQQGGVQNQSDVFRQLQAVASGQGPNPALAQLNNATGQNVAQQAALMGSQRGASANPGLLARQAAMQGGNIQQNAAGQAAALQAQQSLGALGQLGGIAGQQVGQLQGAQNAYNQFAQNAQGNVLSGLQGQNQANVGNVSQQNQANAGVAQQNAHSQMDILKGVTGALGTAVKGFSGGGEVESHAVRHLMGLSEGGIALDYSQGSERKVPGKASVKGDSKKNDTVPAMLSPGEIVVPRSHSNDPEKAAAFVKAVILRNRKK